MTAEAAGAGDGAGGEAAVRIASMLASATEIVVALGLEDRLAAISHECDWPAHVLDRPRLSRPRFDPAGLSSGEVDRAVRQAMLEFGSVYEIDAVAFERLRPDLVVTQAMCEVCAVPTPGVREVVERLGLEARVLSLDAHTIEDILESVMAVGRAAGAVQRADSLVTELRSRIDAIRARVAGLDRPRVLAIEWLDPPFAPGHWVPGMIDVAGGVNLVGDVGARSAQVAWDAMRGLDPDVLLIMPCGYGLEASAADADRFAVELERIAAGAIAGGRAWVVDGSAYFNRSGPRTIDGIEILAQILHPAALGEPPAAAARRWYPADGGED